MDPGLLRCELWFTKAYAAQIMIMFDYIIRVQIKEIAIHSCGTTLNLNFGVSFQFLTIPNLEAHVKTLNVILFL